MKKIVYTLSAAERALVDRRRLELIRVLEMLKELHDLPAAAVVTEDLTSFAIDVDDAQELPHQSQL